MTSLEVNILQSLRFTVQLYICMLVCVCVATIPAVSPGLQGGGNPSSGAISLCQLAIAAWLCRSRNAAFIGASDNESTNFPTWWTLYTQGLRIMLRIGRLNRDPYFNNYSIVFCHVYIYICIHDTLDEDSDSFHWQLSLMGWLSASSNSSKTCAI